MEATYIIPQCNLDELRNRITKLNRRAAKLRVEEVDLRFTVDHRRNEARALPGHAGHTKFLKTDESVPEGYELTGGQMDWLAVTVSGNSPSFAGWHLVAVLQSVETEKKETLNIVRTVPGEECPAWYREQVGICDHCKTRRRRNETFVVRHESGEHKAVGRNCLKDFLAGHADPHALAQYAEIMASLGELCESSTDEGYYGSGGYVRHRWDLQKFLAWVIGNINKEGWLSRSAAYERGWSGKATADSVIRLLVPPYPSGDGGRAYAQWKKEHTENDPGDQYDAEVLEAIEWAQSLEIAEDAADSYLANVNTIARVNSVESSTAGIAASIIVAYRKSKERETKKRALESGRGPSRQHVGTIKKRMEMEITVRAVIRTENQWGVTGIHSLFDKDGNGLVWFASGGPENWLVQGKRYKVKATVTKHDVYRNEPQTTVNRVTVIEELE